MLQRLIHGEVARNMERGGLGGIGVVDDGELGVVGDIGFEVCLEDAEEEAVDGWNFCVIEYEFHWVLLFDDGEGAFLQAPLESFLVVVHVDVHAIVVSFSQPIIHTEDAVGE